MLIIILKLFKDHDREKGNGEKKSILRIIEGIESVLRVSVEGTKEQERKLHGERYNYDAMKCIT